MLERAFSIVEMMVVVSLIAVVSFFIVPGYQRYIQRSEYVEIVSVLRGFLPLVLSKYNATGAFPAEVFQTLSGTDRSVTNFTVANQFTYTADEANGRAYWGFRLTNFGADADIFLCLTPKLNSVAKTYCGTWGNTPEAQDIKDLLPTDCQDTIVTDCQQ